MHRSNPLRSTLNTNVITGNVSWDLMGMDIKNSAVGKGAGQSPALVRWYAAFPAWRWYAGTLVRCFPRLALVRWYAATLNGRRGAGTLNCAGTLLRWMAGPTLVRWYAAFKGGIWNLHAFSREIGFQALIVKIIQPAAKAPASQSLFLATGPLFLRKWPLDFFFFFL